MTDLPEYSNRIKSTERILQKELFFGMDLPEMDLNKLVEVMGTVDILYSFMEESADKLPDGCEFIFDLIRFLRTAGRCTGPLGHDQGE